MLTVLLVVVLLRERVLVEFFANNQLTLVKKKKDCERLGIPYEGTIKHIVPDEYAECGFSYFLADGYCPELDCIVELKGGDKSGTTEEKVFFDLEKLRDDCYGSAQYCISLRVRKRLISVVNCSPVSYSKTKTKVSSATTFMCCHSVNSQKKFLRGCKPTQHLIE